jgi:hypothetical protein
MKFYISYYQYSITSDIESDRIPHLSVSFHLTRPLISQPGRVSEEHKATIGETSVMKNIRLVTQ